MTRKGRALGFHYVTAAQTSFAFYSLFFVIETAFMLMSQINNWNYIKNPAELSVATQYFHNIVVYVQSGQMTISRLCCTRLLHNFNNSRTVVDCKQFDICFKGKENNFEFGCSKKFIFTIIIRLDYIFLY